MLQLYQKKKVYEMFIIAYTLVYEPNFCAHRFANCITGVECFPLYAIANPAQFTIVKHSFLLVSNKNTTGVYFSMPQLSRVIHNNNRNNNSSNNNNSSSSSNNNISSNNNNINNNSSNNNSSNNNSSSSSSNTNTNNFILS